MLSALIKFLRLAAALSLSLLLIAVVLVILGAKLNFDATWASGLSSFLLAWTVMLGGALAYAEKSHLGLDILVDKFDPATRQTALRTGHILVLSFATAIMIKGGSLLTLSRFDMGQTIPSIGISQGWFYLSIPLAGALIALSSIAHLIHKD